MTTAKKMPQDIIDIMNAEAQSKVEKGMAEPYEALRLVGHSYMLEVVRASDQCVVFRDPLGRLVNLWIEAPTPGIGSGGLGFDDQIEWIDEEEP